MLLWAFQPFKLPILTSQFHPAWRAIPNLVSHPYLIFRNKWDIKHFLFFLTFSSPMLVLLSHVILQLILYKLWSKMLLWEFQPYKLPILTSQLHPAWRATPKFGVIPYLIFRNKWDITHFLFFLTFSYHWEILYEPHCQWCWVKFTHAGHVILHLILYKVWSKMLLWEFQPYNLPILTSQLHPAWRATPNLVSHPYLIFRNKWDIKHFLFFLTNFQLVFTHAGHVILQLILYKLWSKMLLWEFPTL